MKLNMQGIRIGYTPFENSENAYTARTVEILSRLGTVSKAPTLRSFLRSPLSYRPNSYEFIIANWIENGIVNHKGRLSVVSVLKFVLNVVLFKVLSRKTIFVRHNNYPHHASPAASAYAARIIDWAEMFFDYVVTHSGHNATSKRKYIPHPLYKHAHSAECVQSQQGDYFLFFGRILPYKKIETLVEAIPAHVRLVIAGSAPDKNYIKFLRGLAVTKDIQLIAEFVSDERAVQLCKSSRGIVITHNDNDMIVSGTFFYALSLGIPLYTVSTPFAEWACKTLEVPGLHVAKDIQSLCAAIALSTGPVKQLTASEQSKVEELFGDDVIETKWSEIFQTITANT